MKRVSVTVAFLLIVLSVLLLAVDCRPTEDQSSNSDDNILFPVLPGEGGTDVTRNHKTRIHSKKPGRISFIPKIVKIVSFKLTYLEGYAFLSKRIFWKFLMNLYSFI